MKNHDAHSGDTAQQDPVRLSFYATPEHQCSYLEDKQAITLFADPSAELDNHTYSTLSQYGFRRSGKHVYRPSCVTCSACVPIRIPTARFTRSRSQKRVWRANQDIEASLLGAEFREEQHALYNKYIQSRHPDGGMNDPDPDKYIEFLTSDWSVTRFIEFRLDSKLVAVAVLDLLEDGISAVYTFFDPELKQRSLGTLGILWSIEFARESGREWLYLGYLIKDCPKMSYKMQFQPQQSFIQGHWVSD
ncbi:MAG: arginyltransferase [Gammaproteobacteria bacterium]|nr:arginyltransferase [Gammaproteobacteria bacterium]